MIQIDYITCPGVGFQIQKGEVGFEPGTFQCPYMAECHVPLNHVDLIANMPRPIHECAVI